VNACGCRVQTSIPLVLPSEVEWYCHVKWCDRVDAQIQPAGIVSFLYCLSRPDLFFFLI
jgi:hypothetical protein